jgi:hypothetical protein
VEALIGKKILVVWREVVAERYRSTHLPIDLWTHRTIDGSKKGLTDPYPCGAAWCEKKAKVELGLRPSHVSARPCKCLLWGDRPKAIRRGKGYGLAESSRGGNEIWRTVDLDFFRLLR